METLRMEGSTSWFINNIDVLGLRGLYSGCKAYMLHDIPFTASYFPLFCVFKTQSLPFLTAHNTEGAACTVAALAAGMISTAVIAHLDVMKTRIQAKAGRARPVRSSSSAFIAAYSEEEVPVDIAGTVRELVVRQGWRGLLCGTGPRLGNAVGDGYGDHTCFVRASENAVNLNKLNGSLFFRSRSHTRNTFPSSLSTLSPPHLLSLNSHHVFFLPPLQNVYVFVRVCLRARSQVYV